MKKLGRRLIATAFGALAGLSVFVAGLLAVFGVPWTAAAFATLGATCLIATRYQVGGALAGLILVAMGAGSWRVPLHEYADRVEVLRTRQARHRLSRRDLSGIFVLNQGMALCGYALGFTEVAEETAQLGLPGESTRYFHSNMPLGSPRVRRVIARWTKTLPHSPPGTVRTFGPKRVAFRYSARSESLRVALALNPVTLSATARAHEDGVWSVDLTGDVDVTYRHRGILPLGQVDGRRIVIDEGLFYALEEAGWHHPYRARWRWSMRADDARLADRATIERAWSVAAMLRLAAPAR